MARQNEQVTRQEALRDYLREVAKDLIMRGLIRGQQGMPVSQILRQEPSVVIGSIMRDLREAGLLVGSEIVSGFLSSIFKR